MNKRKEKYPDWTDSKLLELYKQSADKEVITELFFRYINLVSGISLKYLKDSEGAKDAVSAIYEELLPKALTYEIKEFKNWLYSVTKNHCLSLLRKNNSSELPADDKLESIEDYGGVDQAIAREERYELLEKCLGGLSTEQSRVIRLFYFDNKCYNEISLETGYEWNKVRSLIQNGKRNLKNCMETA